MHRVRRDPNYARNSPYLYAIMNHSILHAEDLNDLGGLP